MSYFQVEIRLRVNGYLKDSFATARDTGVVNLHNHAREVLGW